MSTITETMTTMPTINEQNGNTTTSTTTTSTKKDQAPSQIDETTFIKTTTISSSSKSSTSSSTSTSNGHPALTANGNSLTPNTEQPEQLKIIGHLKNIELINEQRRVFLNNTVSSETSREQERQLLETTQSETLPNGDVLQRQQSERTSIIRAAENGDSKGDEREHVLSAKVTIVPANQTVNPKAETPQTPLVAPLKSPMTPPPKPPMLSRTRSVGQGDNRASIQSITSPTSPTAPILSTTVTTTTLAEPAHVQTIQVEAQQQQSAGVQAEETDSTDTAIAEVKLRRPAAKQQQGETAEQMEANCNAEKPITSKHYEHLIEELKCPGCAIPMKAPILLCETGHSICEQCTRILMMCPLCKEPFTKIRSHTVEALCSKAHFRCVNAPGGCTVRLQKDLLTWHEKQCVYKPMKCFMGRVWGDCQWDGREIQWKEHLETEHANRVFQAETMDLIWNMGVKQKPLTGYYVFEAFDEMFNFYAIHDKERILYTMTCTSSVKEKKHHFAYEVTMIHPCNEALAITQKFPVHSEYDSDILMEGTCVSITLSDLAKFIDDDKLLHYRVRIMQVNSPRKSKAFLHLPLATAIPKDFQNTQIAGVNLKSVPSDIILTRREDLPLNGNGHSPALSTNSHEPPSTSEDEVEKIRREYNRKIHEDGDSESDPEFEAFIAKRWGTPQLHFNRKYLKNISSDSSSNGEHYKNGDSLGRMQDDRVSIASTNVSYKKRMSNTLRKSFRSLKSEFNGMKAFGKKSPEKILTE